MFNQWNATLYVIGLHSIMGGYGFIRIPAKHGLIMQASLVHSLIQAYGLDKEMRYAIRNEPIPELMSKELSLLSWLPGNGS